MISIIKISDQAPQFPCWLWSISLKLWARYESQPYYEKLATAQWIYWHPDQPTAPTAKPGETNLRQETEGNAVRTAPTPEAVRDASLTPLTASSADAGTPSDTPRTDKLEYEQECNFDVGWEDHSRTLERELVAAKENLNQVLTGDRPGQIPWHNERYGKLLLNNMALVKDLAARDAEIARLKEANMELERERDLAIAHDTQPYPTASAYEAVCAALEKHKQTHAETLAKLEAANHLIAEQNQLGKERQEWALKNAETIRGLNAQLTALQSEHEKQRQECTKNCVYWQERAGKAENQLEAVRKDSERLDWLESQYSNIRISDVKGASEIHRCTWGAPMIRKCIDAALTPQAAPTKREEV